MPNGEDDTNAEFHLPGVEALRQEEMWGMIHDDDFHAALITGCAGSGKTTVSVYRLIRLNNQASHVRLLTSQNMLVVFIKNLVVNNSTNTADIQRRVPLQKINTFHDWLYNQVNIHFDISHQPPIEQIHQEFIQRGFTERRDAELLIDEGQDLPLWVYEVIPRFYKRFLVSADQAQGVRPGLLPDHVDCIRRQLQAPEHQPSRHYPLGQNFRNTYETYRFARQFLPQEDYQDAWDDNILKRLREKNRHGRKPLVIPYHDPAVRDEHMRKILRNAVGSTTVGILCPIGPGIEHHSGEAVGSMYRLVTSWGFAATPYHNELPVPDKLKRFIVTTFISAKGLEFDVVVIPRMNFFRNPQNDEETKIREEMYVACTRARSRLYIYRDQQYPQFDPIAAFNSDTYDTEELTAEK